MKLYNKVFDIFLYESFFCFLFGGALHIIEDPTSRILIPLGAISFVIAIILGITGRAFHLFQEEEPSKDF